MQILQKILILIFIAAISGAGYYIYTNKEFLFPKEKEVVVTPQVTEEKVDINKLLAENPSANATIAELEAFSSKVYGYSVETSTLDVTSCSPEPVVARVNWKKPVNFKNNDSVAHTLINGNLTIVVPANSQKMFPPNFPGPGIYGYSCDSNIVGIFFVLP